MILEHKGAVNLQSKFRLTCWRPTFDIAKIFVRKIEIKTRASRYLDTIYIEYTVLLHFMNFDFMNTKLLCFPKISNTKMSICTPLFGMWILVKPKASKPSTHVCPTSKKFRVLTTQSNLLCLDGIIIVLGETREREGRDSWKELRVRRWCGWRFFEGSNLVRSTIACARFQFLLHLFQVSS